MKQSEFICEFALLKWKDIITVIYNSNDIITLLALQQISNEKEVDWTEAIYWWSEGNSGSAADWLKGQLRQLFHS